ncbi:MAG: GNAT family N-acetyltransferase [Chitinophagaceae bacterium]
MIIRQAVTADIPQIQIVRNLVKENRLSDSALVPDSDVEDYISRRGKGWVYEDNQRIVGFAIADLEDNNIWALFIDPAFEGKGIGKLLHDNMLSWYFDQNKEFVWLSTDQGTRAEMFYRKAGWRETGVHGKGEIKFEMTSVEWEKISQVIK